MDGNRNFADLNGGTVKRFDHYPKDLFGVPFDVAFIPIKNEKGEVIALFNLLYSMDDQDQLQQLMDATENLTNQLIDSVQHVAAHSEELSATTEEIRNNSKQAVQKSGNVTQVASFIREISEQTNLLGLNAAIEAARVGKLVQVLALLPKKFANCLWIPKKRRHVLKILFSQFGNPFKAWRMNLVRSLQAPKSRLNS